MAENVLSEVHTFADMDGKIYFEDQQSYLTRFYFRSPNITKQSCATHENINVNIQKDDDGDLVLPIREKKNANKNFVTLEHALATSLSDVGLQIWKGSIFLCDFILEKGQEIFAGKSVLELGCGTGLCGLIASCFSENVYCTDTGNRNLIMCQRNIERNKSLYGCKIKKEDFPKVLDLDWLQYENSWNLSRKQLDYIFNCDIILAADVIYDDEITDAFFATIMKILKTGNYKSLYVSLEKRLNFTLDDLDVVAPAQEYFINWLQELKASDDNWDYKKISPDFDSYFEYDRNKELELWKVEYKLVINETIFNNT